MLKNKALFKIMLSKPDNTVNSVSFFSKPLANIICEPKIISNAKNIKRKANKDVNMPPPTYFSLPYSKMVSVPRTV